jgi:hypothetical protein
MMIILNFEFLVLNYFFLATEPHGITRTEVLGCLEAINRGSRHTAQGVKDRKPESSEAMKLGWQIGYMAEDARHTMLEVIDNFEFLVLNYFLDTDHHGYTRFIVCCMWFVGQGSVSLYSFLQVIFYRCDSINPDKTALKQPSQLLTFLFINSYKMIPPDLHKT